MRKFTVDYMKDNLDACYSRKKLKKLWGDNKSLTALEILSLDIPAKDKVWFIDLNVLPKKIMNRVYNDLFKFILNTTCKEFPNTSDVVRKIKNKSIRNRYNFQDDLDKINDIIELSNARMSCTNKDRNLVIGFFSDWRYYSAYEYKIYNLIDIFHRMELIDIFHRMGLGEYVLDAVMEILKDVESKEGNSCLR